MLRAADMPWADASTEPLDVIEVNECDAPPGLATARFRRCFNEIASLRAVVKRLDHYREALVAREYDPGSSTVRELLDEARAALRGERVRDYYPDPPR